MVMAHVSKSAKQPDVLVSQASPMMVLSNVQNAKTLCSSTQIATSAPGSWMNLMSAVRISSIECHELSGRAQVVLATVRLPIKDQHYKAQTASSTGPGDTASWMVRLLEREAHTTSWCLLALSSVYSSTQVALELWRDTDSLILSLRSSSRRLVSKELMQMASSRQRVRLRFYTHPNTRSQQRHRLRCNLNTNMLVEAEYRQELTRILVLGSTSTSFWSL